MQASAGAVHAPSCSKHKHAGQIQGIAHASMQISCLGCVHVRPQQGTKMRRCSKKFMNCRSTRYRKSWWVGVGRDWQIMIRDKEGGSA